MARLLVQLKLRQLTNALRASTGAKVSFIVSTTFAVLVMVGAFLGLALMRGTATSVDLTTVIFTVFAFGWLILPIFVFGLDSTLDPATLQLYPLRTRPLAVGLLSASAAGAWPVANVIGLLGVTVGLARGGLGVLFAVLAVVLQVLFCMVLARFVTTGMAGLLRSRRGRDLGVFLVIPLFALYEFFAQVIPRVAAEGKINASSFNGFDSWIRWLPPGLAAHAIQDASDGRAGIALGRLAILAAVIIVLGWLWIRSLRRALVTTDTSARTSQVRGTALPLARYGRGGAVAARYWIYQRREPMSLAYWALVAVITAAASASAILQPKHHPAIVLVGAVFGAAFAGGFHANAIGLTGSPFVYEALALTGRRDLRSYFGGESIVLAVIAVPLLTALSFGLAAAAHSPVEGGVAATAVALAALGGSLGMSAIFSVVAAYPMEKRAGNPMAQPASGSGGYRFAVLGTLAATAVLAVPAILAAVFTSSVPEVIRAPLLIAGAAAYGFALALAGVRIAAAAAEQKLPELVQIAMRSKL
jgi:ABC-2 type transport system permease protein